MSSVLKNTIDTFRLLSLAILHLCCYALIRSNFFINISLDMASLFLPEGIRHTSSQAIILSLSRSRLGVHQTSPPVGFLMNLPTVHMDVPPDQFTFRIKTEQTQVVTLSPDSEFTSKARRLWSVNETRPVHVHPMVTLINLLYGNSGVFHSRKTSE